MTNFIMVNNVLITEEHKLQLNKEELYVFILLQMSKDLNDEFYFTLSLLNDKSKIPFGSSKQRSVNKIRESLVSLSEKGIIRLSNNSGGKLENIKPNDVVVAKILQLDEKGFTMFSLEMFNYIEKFEHVYIYLATHRWANSDNGVFTCSHGRWSRILQCSKRHAINLVNEAVEKRIIYKNIGDYNKEGKQDINQYKTTHFFQKEKTKHTKKQDEIFVKKLVEKEITKNNPLNNVTDWSTDLEYFDIYDLEESYHRFNTFNDNSGNNAFPMIKDYAIMIELNKAKENRGHTELESVVFEAGVVRLKILEKNPKTKEIMEDMIKRGKALLKQKEKSANSIPQSSYTDSDDDPFGED